METIKDKVAIVGMGCTKFGELWDKGAEDLMIDACYEAFEDAGLDSEDIQAAWLASLVSGCTGSRLSNAIKLDYIPVTRVENFCCGGTDALRNACYAVASGAYDIVLAVGIEKLKDHLGGFGQFITAPFDSSKVEVDLPPVNFFGQFATRYFHRYGISMEEGKRTLAKIAVKNHHNGTLSPKAHLRWEVTEEQVLKSPIISWPLSLFDCCGLSDGGAAAILTTPEIAKTLKDDYILVKGLGLANGNGSGLFDSDYEFTSMPENVRCSAMAYEQAGINNPREEIDLAVVHDCFTIHELILYEDLGFSPRGKASEDVEAGTFTLEGDLPVNTDGGLKCFGHPLSASGIRMVYEVYKQLQGKAGKRQVKDAKVGLTHNLGGLPAHFNCAVAIFGKEPG
ncbi:MAG: acetyl-CoA acetyltransferase [Thermodesulfobacteriota bacterium]|nr:acetyl-CoA acetyltransferase [Thermodesulfobacteriota bacterium]